MEHRVRSWPSYIVLALLLPLGVEERVAVAQESRSAAVPARQQISLQSNPVSAPADRSVDLRFDLPLTEPPPRATNR